MDSLTQLSFLAINPLARSQKSVSQFHHQNHIPAEVNRIHRSSTVAGEGGCDEQPLPECVRAGHAPQVRSQGLHTGVTPPLCRQ